MTEIENMTLGEILAVVTYRFRHWGTCAVGERFHLSTDSGFDSEKVVGQGFGLKEAELIMADGLRLFGQAESLEIGYEAMQTRRPNPLLQKPDKADPEIAG